MTQKTILSKSQSQPQVLMLEYYLLKEFQNIFRPEVELRKETIPEADESQKTKSLRTSMYLINDYEWLLKYFTTLIFHSSFKRQECFVPISGACKSIAQNGFSTGTILCTIASHGFASLPDTEGKQECDLSTYLTKLREPSGFNTTPQKCIFYPTFVICHLPQMPFAF